MLTGISSYCLITIFVFLTSLPTVPNFLETSQHDMATCLNLYLLSLLNHQLVNVDMNFKLQNTQFTINPKVPPDESTIQCWQERAWLKQLLFSTQVKTEAFKKNHITYQHVYATNCHGF